MKTVWYFLAVILVVLFAGTSEAWDCYDTWSRCTGWSSPATGILWQNCNSYCQGCKNAASGRCALAGSTTCFGNTIPSYQCQCSGTWTGSNKPTCIPGGLG